MATTASKKASRTQKRGKGKPDFHTVETLKKTTEDFTHAARQYRDKYAKKHIKKGTEFVRKATREPGKVVEETWQSSKTFLGDLKTDPRSVMDDFIDTGKDYADDIGNDIKDSLKGTMDTGKALAESLEKDLRHISVEVSEKIGQFIDDHETTHDIKTAISKKLKKVPDNLNLASKKDINRLRKEIRALNAKIDELSKG